MNGAGGCSCSCSVLERESTGVEIAYECTGCNFLTSVIRNNDTLVNLKVMRTVFGEIESHHSRPNRFYGSSIDYISTDFSVHSVEIAIPEDLVSTYNAVALVGIGRSKKFFSSHTEWLGHTKVGLLPGNGNDEVILMVGVLLERGGNDISFVVKFGRKRQWLVV
jgi:hypothetical protein